MSNDSNLLVLLEPPRDSRAIPSHPQTCQAIGLNVGQCDGVGQRRELG